MMIDREDRGIVTVLHLKGKMTLGEGDELLKECIAGLIAAQRLYIVLDLAGVPYIDSAGNGEIARTYTFVARQGGRFVLCSLTKRIIDLLAITKLLTVYETYDSVDEAVLSFEMSQFDVSCPVCRPRCWTAYREGPLLSCDVCDVRFLPRRRPALLTAEVHHLWWITYYENGYGRESVQMTVGGPCVIAITGRLDLFAFDVVQLAWQALPQPRRAIFDTTGVVALSAVGQTKLEQVCAARSQDRAAILTRPFDPEGSSSGVFQVGRSTFVRRADAIAELGDPRRSQQAIEVAIRPRV